MQTPIEISFFIMTRTSSGAGVRQRAGPAQQEGFQFIQAMEEALANTEPRLFNKDTKSSKTAVENDAMPEEPKKPAKDAGADEALAAGAMGDQTPVVFILEGDNESATDLDICVQAPASAESSARTNRMRTGDRPVAADSGDYGPAAPEEDLTAAANATEGKAPASAAKADSAPEAAARGETPGIANSKAPSVQDAASNEGASGGEDAIESVTARMPVARTSERHEKEENGSAFSEKGNLGPLENENDEVQSKGQKGKTYSETAIGAKNAAQAVPEPATNAPAPLAGGIVPEQFRAEQQMRQPAPHAPVRTENLLTEMVSRIETMKTESQNTMSIQLKPEFLGKVALEIAMDAAGLHVKIDAADSGVRAMLNGQINTLIESLGNKGIEIVEVEVTYTGIDNGAPRESRDEQEQPNRSRRQHYDTEAVDAAAYYSVLPFEMLDYYIDAGVSSVEYRA